MYYAFIKDDKIIGKGECEQIGIVNYRVSKEMYDNLERYIVSGEHLVENPDYKPDHSAEVNTLKAYLESTDYVVIKIAEGEATTEDYAEILALRRQARARIRELNK